MTAAHRSRSRPAGAVAALAALALLAACSRPAPAEPAPARQAAAEACALSIFIWPEYLDPALVREFERRTGCRVYVDLYQDNEALLARLAAGGDAQYDLVVPGNYLVPALVKRGLLAELRHERLPNLRNLDPAFADPAYDRGLRHSVPYQWGTVGLAARRRPGQPIDESWGWILDPARRPGGFLLLDSYREMLGSALRYRGYSVNTTEPRELAEAVALLVAARRRALGWEGGVEARARVLARGASAAVTYNGDTVRGARGDPEVVFFQPREGGVIWVDSLAITARAPHREAAERFIDFILEPKVGAHLSDFNVTATPNLAARALVNPQDARNPAIYPPPEVMARLEYVADLGDANKLYEDAWAKVKAR
jgi:spermidine/putrescine transport system substrate-binding protein